MINHLNSVFTWREKQNGFSLSGGRLVIAMTDCTEEWILPTTYTVPKIWFGISTQ